MRNIRHDSIKELIFKIITTHTAGGYRRRVIFAVGKGNSRAAVLDVMMQNSRARYLIQLAPIISERGGGLLIISQ